MPEHRRATAPRARRTGRRRAVAERKPVTTARCTRLDRARPEGGGHRPGAGHGRRPEGRQRPPRHRHEPGAGGVPAVPEGDAAQPGRPALARPRPLRAVLRAQLASPSTPSSSSAAGASSSRTSRRCAPGARKTPATPSTATPPASRPPPGRSARASRNAVGMAMAARRERGLLDPDAAEGDSPFDHHIYAHVQRRRPRGGRQRRGLLARRHPAARQPHADLRRQPDLDRGRHRRRLHRGRRASATRRTAGTCRPSTGPTTAPSTSRTCPRCTRAIRAAEAVTDRPSFIVLRTIIAWPAPNAQGTGAAHGSALGAEEVAATKEILGFDPELHFEVPDDVLAHTRVAGRAAARRHRPRGRSSSDAWTTKPSADAALLERLDHATLPAGWADALPTFEADPKGVATRKASGAVINALAGGHARAVGRLGRPRRSPTTPRSRTRRRSCPRAARPTSGPATRSPAGCCTSASASTPWARS